MALQYDKPVSGKCEPVSTFKEPIEIVSKIVWSVPKEIASLPQTGIDPSMIADSEGKTPKDKSKNANEQQAQTLFQQYWHIIVPAVLIYTLMTAGGGIAAAPGAAAAATG